jgi:hypothetical protein
VPIFKWLWLAEKVIKLLGFGDAEDLPKFGHFSQTLMSSDTTYKQHGGQMPANSFVARAQWASARSACKN